MNKGGKRKNISISFRDGLLKENALTVELVGIKNLKTTGNWRLEFDVYEIDSDKVKELFDKINKALMMALVELDG